MLYRKELVDLKSKGGKLLIDIAILSLNEDSSLRKELIKNREERRKNKKQEK